MAFGKTLVVCSGFEGQLLTEAGEPVSGITLKRTWTWGWKDETGTEETVSGADGRFRFDPVTRSSFTAFLPHEPSMTQEIVAELPDGSKRIWFSGKLNYEADSELGRPMDMLCYVDRESTSTASFSGTCVERSPND
jgi:hypothetical protein